jgi:mono/diheme cytochrome c family protein
MIALAAAGVALMTFPIDSAAQPGRDYGKREYDSNCAVCHGKLGKGDGPFAAALANKTGADITMLAKKNGGVFPIQHVTEVIDGRREVKSHGPRDMPVWGADYLARAKEAGEAVHSPFDPETIVQYRIWALAEYIYRLQVH